MIMDELKELREELARLRERVAVLEAKGPMLPNYADPRFTAAQPPPVQGPIWQVFPQYYPYAAVKSGTTCEA